MVKLIVLVAFCILGVSMVNGDFNKEDALKQFLEKADACAKDVGAAPTDIDELLKEMPASTKEGKCMRACIMKKYEVMGDDGKFSREGALEKARIFTENDPEQMTTAAEIIDHCMAGSVSSDHCEAAEEYGHCFKGQLAKHGVKLGDI